MELLYFFLGIFCATVVYPVVQAWLEWHLTWIEAKKMKLNEAITDSNIKMQQAVSSAGDQDTRAIGFSATWGEEEEECEYED